MTNVQVKTWYEKEEKDAIDYLNFIIRDCEKQKSTNATVEKVSVDAGKKQVTANIKGLTSDELDRLQTDRSVEVQ